MRLSIILRTQAPSKFRHFAGFAEIAGWARGVQFAVAYTWSKAMGLTAGDGDGLPRYRPRRIWLYGPLPYDQSHGSSINYLWDLPKASAKWQNPVARHVLDNWHLSGITTFATGTPQSIGFGTTDNADYYQRWQRASA